MEVRVFNNQSILPIDEVRVQQIAQAVVFEEKKAFDEAAIHFVTVPAICSLHQRYFNDPTPTDCISFPMDDMDEEGYKVLGEVFVSPQAALDYVAAQAGDPFHETTLYIVHGLLHLMGYDDMNSVDKAQMREAELHHMRRLAEQGLLLAQPLKL